MKDEKRGGNLSNSSDQSDDEKSHQDTNENDQVEEVSVLHNSEQQDDRETESENEQVHEDKETRKSSKKGQKLIQESRPKRTGAPKSKKFKKTNDDA